MITLKVGNIAPAFSLPDQLGALYALKDYQGKWLLLYFYPRDATPGCTIEACTLRDNFPHFKKMKATVVGISVDSVKSHAKFADKQKLPFTLLADEDKKVVNLYGVWDKKKFMGREYMGILRTSFLIDPEGTIIKIYEGVNSAKHAEEVLRDLQIFQRI